MGEIKVLVVDDSIVFRSQIKAALDGVEGISVVGVAANGKIALRKMTELSVDLVTLDLEMPEMSGIETIAQMKALKLTPKVIVFASMSRRGADTALAALAAGANDFVAKPSGDTGSFEDALNQIKSDLVPKIRQFASRLGASPVSKSPGSVDQPKVSTSRPASGYTKVDLDTFVPSVIVIGSSTGGPSALETVFSTFDSTPSCPILLVQHMPPVFTATLATRLERLAGVPAAEAKHGEKLEANRIYVAPGDFHMSLLDKGGNVSIQLDQSPKRNSVRPAVDTLFESAASIYGRKCFGLVLTGMGEDGLHGAIAIKNAKGAMVIQDKATSVVFGMPGAVHDAGAYDRMMALPHIGSFLKKLAAKSSTSVNPKKRAA